MDKIKALAIKLREGLLKILLSPVKLAAQSIRLLLRPFLHPVTVGLVGLAIGFLIGGRMHETGHLAGMLGKDFKGSTVFLSGVCSTDGEPRLPAFAEDEVKVTSIDGEKLLGVVRLTREHIECKLSDIAIDKLPLLSNLAKSPAVIPELKQQEKEVKQRPAFKDLEKKTIILSGSCVSDKNEAIPPFTDEKVDVTSADQSQENKELFVLTGIKKSDKQVVRCLSNAIKYEMFVPETPKQQEEAAKVAEEKNKSQVGEIILITGSCFPDERTNLNKKSKSRALYKLANTRVEVLEDKVDPTTGRLSYVAGTVLDDPYKTEQIVCDRSKIPFGVKDYDPEGMKLDNKATTEQLDSTAAPVPTPATAEGVQSVQ